MSDPEDQSLEAAFANGNYHRVAASRREDCWRTYAALGLCGNVAPALNGLARFDLPEARFYEGVVHWIDGDEDAAARLLERSQSDHAARLLALIRKPRINILSQLPWSQFGEGPHMILNAARTSHKFASSNIGFSPGDMQNAPSADIRQYFDPNNPPDFYLAQMVEWQLIPPNLQELPCPIIGHTADFDLHIQALHPWLQLFDALIVTDETEHRDVARLTENPVATFPKTFCLPKSLPPPPKPNQRDIDILLTGTVFHEYHREKAEILHQISRIPDVEPFIVNGYLEWGEYHAMLARSLLSVSHIRHPGASPSRGIEALAMGTVLVAQPETTLKLWVGEAEGLLTYELKNQGLRSVVTNILQQSSKHEAAARHGMAIIRREFEPDRLGAQYLRFATFLAARPTGQRRVAESPGQKRIVAWQGWLQRDGGVYGKIRDRALEVLNATPADQQTVETLNSPCREMMLELVRQRLTGQASGDELLSATLEIYALAIQLLPNSLVLRFNYIRAALHFGSNKDIDDALAVARDTLATPPSSLTLDPADDVMTWDYCSTFFNYRSYLDIVTEAFMEKFDRAPALRSLILASIEYYLGRMTGNGAHFANAVQYDPEFPVYRLWLAKTLIRAGDDDSTARAMELLSQLAAHTNYAVEAWTLLKALRQEHGLEIPDEFSTESALGLLETRTLLASDNQAIRNGPYFRSQRLGLARNDGYELLKSSRRPARLSVLLADMNGSHYHRLSSSLTRQTLPRDDFEVIVVDVFDRLSPTLTEFADTAIACGQSEYLYNRNAAFNTALANASGAFVAIFDRDTDLPGDTLESLLREFEDGAAENLLVVNQDAAPFDRKNLHFAALSRARALRCGGLEEAPTRAGGLGGPYELVQRLLSDHPRIETLDSVVSIEDAGGPDITPLLRDLWFYKLSPARRLPENESPAIRSLRKNRSAA